MSRMTDAMVSRGPDGFGIVARDGIALGHRRLRLIDPSRTSQQPMVDANTGLSISFNGAIHNFKELRRELEERGRRFVSQGDTEVILHAYAEWGERCVERLMGLFAFAIWERDYGRIFLACDRLGIKPLYLATIENGVRFASTLPALLASGIDPEHDPVGVHEGMTLDTGAPGPRTALRGVQKLEPGTTLTIDTHGTRRARRYWDVGRATPVSDRVASFEEGKERSPFSLRRVVARRTVADVPMRVLLPGGLDSSRVAGLLAEPVHRGQE